MMSPSLVYENSFFYILNVVTMEREIFKNMTKMIISISDHNGMVHHSESDYF